MTAGLLVLWKQCVLLWHCMPCCCAGGLLGGFLGDWAAARWPNHGRILVCQFSVSVGVPGAVLLFKVVGLATAPCMLCSPCCTAATCTALALHIAARNCGSKLAADGMQSHMCKLQLAPLPQGLPLHPGGGAMAAYLVVLVLGGLLVTWPAPACNK